MQYGLGRVDLNLLAQLALFGISETPERDVADLLRSGQPIEPQTRLLLAEALDGRSKNFHLKFHKTESGAGYRAFMLRRRRLQIGREAIALGLTQGRARAERITAEKYGCSTKTISATITLTRRLDAWVASVRTDSSRDQYSDTALEFAFLYADATNQHPDQALRPSAEGLAELVLHLDDFQAPALRGKRRNRPTI